MSVGEESDGGSFGRINKEAGFEDPDLAYLSGQTISQQIGKILHIARVKADKKASELSVEIGYSKSYLSLIESGNRPLNRRTLKKLREHIFIPQKEFDLLWTYSIRGSGQEYVDVLNSESIIGDPYKEDFIYSVGKAISRDTVDLSPLYAGEEKELEIVLAKDDLGHLGREATVTIRFH